MHRLHSYVESRVFAPPSPRYNFPEDVRWWYTKTCAQLYAKTGVPCIADEHITSPKYVVIFTHGNAENLATVGDFLHTLAERLHAHVYCPEYPSYSRDSKNATEQGCYEAVEKFAAAIPPVAAKRPVILFGYSMGAALALHTADVHRSDTFPKAVILVAPFVSAVSVAYARKEWEIPLSFAFSCFDVFRMREAALCQGHHILVAHGTDDTVVPFTHGQAIARWSAQNTRGVCSFVPVPGADHTSVLEDNSALWPGIAAFLAEVERTN